MGDGNTNENQTLFEIPVKGIEKLASYERGIRGILKKIEVSNCDPELMENVKSMYELLGQLQKIKNSLRTDFPVHS